MTFQFDVSDAITLPSKDVGLNNTTYSFGVPTPTATVTATYNNNIDGLLYGVKWASTSVSFSFPDSINDYEPGYDKRAAHGASFQTLNNTQRAVVRAWLGSGGASSYYNVSSLTPYELTGTNDRDATIRLAMSNVPSTAFAYYPSNAYVEAGDAWFNRSDYNAPVIGNYAYHTFGHELGHTLGLKHGHEAGGVRNVAMNADRDSMEFSIMTYRSYVGHNLSALPYYTNESGGFAQSLMMYDIAAIQHMYGAWFGYNSTNTTYTFSTTTGQMFVNGIGQGTPAANRVFRTIWDGNGIDTYDFSNYSTNLSVDLTPGGWSSFDTSGGHFQQAKLNAGYGGITQYARGNVFNALQYNGDVRSLIENANGGSGNDRIVGNAANNVLMGNSGNDTLLGSSGNDTLTGGAGKDNLDGGTGTDKFIFTARSDSLLAAYDVISGYATGEQIDAPSGVLATTLTASSGNAASLTAAAISAILKSTVFTANSAKAFTVTGQSGIFLAFNDAMAGFNSLTDSIVQIQGYTLGSVPIV